MKPLGNSGLMGRSMRRAVRIAFSLGRDSRLMKPPGILPAAYMRSSMSTVSGKKSWLSRVSSLPTAVTRTTVSPQRTSTAPLACLASLPVSSETVLPPTSTSTLFIVSFVSFRPVFTIVNRHIVRVGRASNSGANACLFAQFELFHKVAVAVHVASLQVVEQTTTLAHHLE